MGTSATLPTVVTTDGRLLLAPLDQYNPYVGGSTDCRICQQGITENHLDGCIYGDGFGNIADTAEAREIAAERIRAAGVWFDENFLDEFHLGRTQRDIVVDGTLHAIEGCGVLIRPIGITGDNVFLVSMATGDLLRLPDSQFSAVTTDVDGRLIEAGAMVEDITSGVRGTVTAVDFGTKVVMVKGRRQFGQRGDYLRVIDVITVRWDTTVVESHTAQFELADVAKALRVKTDDKTPERIRQVVERVIDKHADIDTGSGRLRDLESLLSDEEGTQYREDCHPSTESRVLLGHGEG